MVNSNSLFYKQLATFPENWMSKGWSAASRSDAQQDSQPQNTASRRSTSCLNRYLLFEVSFVLVLLLELLLGGLVGKHIASGKLRGLDMSETYKRRKREEILHELDQRTFFSNTSFFKSRRNLTKAVAKDMTIQH